MTVLTPAQKERGMSLATQEGELRWGWGDWALDVAGPPSRERDAHGVAVRDSTVTKLFREALGELTEALGSDHSLPRSDYLRVWRDGAYAIPAELRQMVRSPWIGETLWRHVPDHRRESLIRELAAEHSDGKNILTERQVRRALGLKGKDGDLIERVELTPADQAALIAQALTDPKVLNAIFNDEDLRDQLEDAVSAMFGRDSETDDDRERVSRNLSEDDQRWEKFQRHVRAGEFGFAEWQSTKFEVTDKRASWLCERAEYLEHVATWLRAIAASEEVTDEALQQLLGG